MTEHKITVEAAIEMRDRIKKKIHNNVKGLNVSCMCVDSKLYDKNKEQYDAASMSTKSLYQSLSTMALNYDILSSAIMQSNHSTTLPGIKNNKGRDSTIAEAISILNSPTNEVVKALRSSRDLAYQANSKNPKTIVLDPLGEDARKYIDNYDSFSERLSTAVRESNRKNIIRVNLVD